MRVELLGFWVLASVSCGGVESSALFGTDGGPASGSDAGHVADAHASGSGTGTGVDSGSVTVGHDAGSTPAVDSGFFHGMDASVAPTVDAGKSHDAGNPTTPPVPCGSTSCSGAEPVCCATNVQQGQTPTFTCTASASACPGVPIQCQSSADCPTGELCCAAFGSQGPSMVSCEASCGGGVEVCDPNATSDTCSGTGQTCNRFGGSGFGYCGPGGGGGGLWGRGSGGH